MDELVDKELEPCAPTGTTPGKRSYNVPSTLVCTSPHDRILERFRGHKSQRTTESSDATSSNGAAVILDGDEIRFNNVEAFPNPQTIDHSYAVHAPQELAKEMTYGTEGRAKPALVPVSPSQPGIETPETFKSKENVAPIDCGGQSESQQEYNHEEGTDDWFGNAEETPKESPNVADQEEAEASAPATSSSEQTNEQPTESRDSTASSVRSTGSSRSTTSAGGKSNNSNVHKGPPTSSGAPKVPSQRSTLTKTGSSSSLGTADSNGGDENQKNDEGKKNCNLIDLDVLVLGLAIP